mgnify:CR=1 FL=1
MDFLINVITFLVGLTLIVKGADWLTDGAASIAHRLHIPTLVIGLTIVAVGTSAPEFVVSMMGALRHSPDIAIGNVVGSNIFNIWAIIGCTALIAPISMTRNNVIRDLPIMVLSSVVLFVMLIDTVLDDDATSNNLSRGDGLVLLCLFAMFMYYTIWMARKERKRMQGENTEDEICEMMPEWLPTAVKKWPMSVYTVMVLVGLSCLVVGGDWMVGAASGIASKLGVSDAIIALTIVSIGTSAPELATSIMAARKGDNEMAIGNIVGSVVFNTLLILGASAVVYPLPMQGITMIDLYTLLAASLMFWLCGKYGNRRYVITRVEGACMVCLQIAYYVYLVLIETT